MSKKIIALIGYMATGKSTIGKKLAKALNLELVDTDEWIIKQQGKDIVDIFEENGEAAFRKMEQDVLESLITKRGILISTGGGIILNPQNRELLRENTFIVTLTAKPATIYERVNGNTDRPLLNDKNQLDKIVKMMEDRKPYYDMGDIIIATDEVTEKQCIGKIIEAYQRSEK